MSKIKRFITCVIPVYACNFRCHYCYLDDHQAKEGGYKKLIMSPEEIAKSLSVERLGGPCYFNLCGVGETMLHSELIELISQLTRQGHFADIITNGTISKKFDELVEALDEEQKRRLMIKFSFHWLELKRKNLLDEFTGNVEKIRNNGISFSIEITPNDELVPYIYEIKKYSIEHFGALPHITVTRSEASDSIPLQTKYSKEEYYKIWSQFDSEMFAFKYRMFGEKRKEFCYAGSWSLNIDLGTGVYRQCYAGQNLGNISEVDRPINFQPIGRCLYPHCVNCHAFLTFGTIPSLAAPTYKNMRDRVTQSGDHWLSRECIEFYSSKLNESNFELPDNQKNKYVQKSEIYDFGNRCKQFVKNVIKRK